MKKKSRIIFLIFVCVFTLWICNSSMPILGYFSAVLQTKVRMTSANLNIAVEDLKVADIEIEGETKDSIHGVLNINTAAVFSFTVKNNGSCAAEYFLDIQIAWDEDLPETGKFFVYPYDISDDDIYEMISKGDYAKAVIGGDVIDNNEIYDSVYGIWETVDSAELLSSVDRGISSKAYSFKLFFYADADIIANREEYQNKFLEIGIVLYSDVSGRETAWASAERRFFRLKSLINLIQPIINEIAAPKTYFVTQTQGINLKTYAAAYDAAEGDISGKIEIMSYPEFNPDMAGRYIITYIVKNSKGVYSDPLQISIIIWDFVKIANGSSHTLMLTSHGRVYAWGYNNSGQLGIGTNSSVTAPTLIETLFDITDITAGDNSSFALDAAGQVYSWGSNTYGQLGIGNSSIPAVNIPTEINQPEEIYFTQISARSDVAGAVTAEGTVYTWGYGGYGALGNGNTSNLYSPMQINLTNIAKISMGQYCSAALTKDGAMYTWGNNNFGGLGNGATMSANISSPAELPYFTNENIKIKGISAGHAHMAAISDNGELFTWGSGGEGRLGNGSTTKKNTPQKISMPESKAVVKAFAGYADTGIITQDGNVYFFGFNSNGKHGSGDTADHWSPALLQGVTDATEISSANNTSFVLGTGRTLCGMGSGWQNLLPEGKSSTTPVEWVFAIPAPY